MIILVSIEVGISVTVVLSGTSILEPRVTRLSPTVGTDELDSIAGTAVKDRVVFLSGGEVKGSSMVTDLCDVVLNGAEVKGTSFVVDGVDLVVPDVNKGVGVVLFAILFSIVVASDTIDVERVEGVMISSVVASDCGKEVVEEVVKVSVVAGLVTVRVVSSLV